MVCYWLAGGKAKGNAAAILILWSEKIAFGKRNPKSSFNFVSKCSVKR
jgi:hypothetical protein